MLPDSESISIGARPAPAVARAMRLLIAESEPPPDRQERRQSVGNSSGETFMELLARMAPNARLQRALPADLNEPLLSRSAIAAHDAVILTGSPLHLYDGSPQSERTIEFTRRMFAARVPAFGSCAGLQAAVVAAGGEVRPGRRPRETGFARRIVATEEGRAHPMLAGRPASWDACAVHSDAVFRLPPGAVRLAGNEHTQVQAAEIRCDGGDFWGVQYHPELSLFELGEALRRQRASLIEDGLALGDADLDGYADDVEALGRDPSRRDIAWRLGLDAEVLDPDRRHLELANFLRWIADR